jgi:1-deoxy-D-xylulose-5-phosphate synthase
MLSRVLRPGHPVLTLEDHSLQSGFGSAVIEHAVGHGLPTQHITCLGMPDRLIAHATRKQQLAEVGLDAAGIAASIRAAVEPKPHVEVSVRSVRERKTLAGETA